MPNATNPTTIECKPSRWFKTRAVGLSGMLIFFALWFFKDGYWGYRDKNAEVVVKQVFLGENEDVAEKADFAVKALDKFNENEYTPETWVAFAKMQVINTPENKDLLPRDFDYSATWPDEIVNGYEKIKNGEMFALWKAYSSRKGLALEPKNKIYDEGTIREQFITCGVCVALLLVALFICLRIMGRSMKVTTTGYTPPGGSEIPFSAMSVIDKRKWDAKGIAIIHYEDEGKTSKAKVDGMIYGQFREEDGAPAEALFSQIMDNFKGEVIELVEDDELEEETT